MQAVRTNVLGTENVLEAAIAAGVQRVVCLSTDKAVYPINAMGISKALMEKVMVAKSRLIDASRTVLAATRYGNVMASRGSVIPLFLRQMQEGKPITLTDPGMTRFLMSLEESVDLGERLLDQALHAFHHHVGEISARQWQHIAHQLNLGGRDELLVEIGTGKRQALEVARQLLRIDEAAGALTNLGAITVHDREGGAIEYASCCQPVPGDPIIGLIDRGRGLVVHTHDCAAVRRKRRRTDASRWVDVEWDAQMAGLFTVTVRVTAAHKPGVLATLARAPFERARAAAR
jgi:hypothetical protein